MSRMHLPDDKMEVTWEDFGKWIQELPEDIKTKQVWFIDLGKMYKGKPIDFSFSPTKEFVGMVVLPDEET